MPIILITGISLLLHGIAVFFALRMIAVTGRRKAWILLSIGIATMGIRRLLSFMNLFAGGPNQIRDLDFEIIGLLGSAIMLAGVVLIKPVFLSIKESEENAKRAQDQLRQSQKLEAIGRLAGGISHDFNNMLTAIIGYGNILKNNIGKDSTLMQVVDLIISSAEKSANLTRQLLAFSRNQAISPRQTELNDLIRGMDKLLQRLIGEDIELKTVFFDSELNIMADPVQIEQVLMNLFTNARDAMPDGGLLALGTSKIYLDDEFCKSHNIDKSGEYALVSISDNGSGMDEKTRQRIFEPFFTTKEFGKGTGLGLSLVYGIIRQHNGNIIVYSEPGKGTTFRVYLPLIKGPVSKEKVPEAALPETGTETILIAEDNFEVRSLLKKMLEGYGYKIIEAPDGEEAVRLFSENEDAVRLLLLDVVLPGKNGKEAGDEIMKIRPDVKILFMSGYTSDVIRQKGIMEPKMEFISKPIMPRELLLKIREMLDRAELFSGKG